MAFALTREAQLTHDEFLRQLPDAVGADYEYRVENDDIVIMGGSKLIRITLTDLGVDHKG